MTPPYTPISLCLPFLSPPPGGGGVCAVHPFVIFSHGCFPLAPMAQLAIFSVAMASACMSSILVWPVLSCSLVCRSNLLLIPTWVRVPSWAPFLGKASGFFICSVSDLGYTESFFLCSAQSFALAAWTIHTARAASTAWCPSPACSLIFLSSIPVECTLGRCYEPSTFWRQQMRLPAGSVPGAACASLSLW